MKSLDDATHKEQREHLEKGGEVTLPGSDFRARSVPDEDGVYLILGTSGGQRVVMAALGLGQLHERMAGLSNNDLSQWGMGE